VLSSAADRWGLLALLTMIRSPDPDTAMLGMGTDLSLAGFDLGVQDNLYSSFITPWSDASAVHTVEPEFHVPAVYNVHPPVPGPNKAASFSDETLFFMFYSAPRDVLQEVAAQELHNRNWRFHKDIRLWLTKESGTAPSQKASTCERGVYTFFDPEIWERVKKDLVIVYDLLEERAPLSVAGAISAPGHQSTTQQPLQPLGMGLHSQGHQATQQSQGTHLGQPQPSHPSAQHPQLHQQQPLTDQIRLQNMSARYQGTRTPGLGGL